MTEYFVAADDARRDAPSRRRARTQGIRRYVMTSPEFFAVEYAINPWMDLAAPVDRRAAALQWESLYKTYLSLGHTVDLVRPEPGLPDMVYAAKGGPLARVPAGAARHSLAQTTGRSQAYRAWMQERGYHVVPTRHVNEGQGDLLLVGEM